MSWRATSWAAEQVTGRPITKLVLLKLADNANDDGVCWPSVPLIAQHTELSVRAVQEHLGRLEAMGLIRIERRTSGAVNLPNVYHLAISPPARRGSGVVQDAHQGGGASRAPLPQDTASRGAADAPGGASARTTYEPPIEPSKEPSLSAPAAAGETDGVETLGAGQPKRFFEFRKAVADTWPNAFPADDLAKAEKAFVRATRTAQADAIIVAAREHGAAETLRKSKRGGRGQFFTKNPSTWLVEGGWRGYAEAAHTRQEVEAATALALSRVRHALGDRLYEFFKRTGLSENSLATLEGLTFEEGPPPVFTASRQAQIIILDRHSAALERSFGAAVTVVLAGARHSA